MTPGRPLARDMVWIPAGSFLMGSVHHDPEEAPASIVFVPPPGPIGTGDPYGWWQYRPAARMAQGNDTSTCQMGFRCLVRS
ncbi:formylglycine-generating enzyme family protein [Synechococcus sp. CS-1332]|uniref:formylglycine-generating enzyme family protein n=1 Tax=Synechococcus sp. CS-1332 TaxID=2847972 RepID=UPI00223BB63B|nr:formylglycine-generating enzyme family protein [Synechococcus sp. CS-1332]